jgi:epidermal growth factor receptor kinase substrate 8
MERFPVALIQEPTAFTSHDPMEIYNNILVFIVGEERAERLGSRSEMHIFQASVLQASFLHYAFFTIIESQTSVLVELAGTVF